VTVNQSEDEVKFGENTWGRRHRGWPTPTEIEPANQISHRWSATDDTSASTHWHMGLGGREQYCDRLRNTSL